MVILFFKLKVYTHKTVKSIEYMVCDILQIADPVIRIKGKKTDDFKDGLYKISECIYDAEALSNLDDRILYLIENTYNLDPVNNAKLQPQYLEYHLIINVVWYKLGRLAGRIKEQWYTLFPHGDK